MKHVQAFCYGSGAILAVFVLFAPKRAAADVTLWVSTAQDLESAFDAADADPTTTYQVYVPDYTYIQTDHTLTLTKGIVILHGSTWDPEIVSIDGGDDHPVFAVTGDGSHYPSVTIQGATITNGLSDFGPGAGLSVQSGSLTLQSCVVSYNKADEWGSGIYVNSGSLYMTDSVVASNKNLQAPNGCDGGVTAGGGGLAVDGTGYAAVFGTTFISNEACHGGAIDVLGNSELYLEDSTLTNNIADRRGGGILFQGGSGYHTLRFDTIAENIAGTLSNPPVFPEGNRGGGIAVGYEVSQSAPFNGILMMYGTIVAQNEVQATSESDPGHDLACESNGFSPDTSENLIGQIGTCAGMLGYAGDRSNTGALLVGSESAPLDPGLNALTWYQSASGILHSAYSTANEAIINDYFWTSGGEGRDDACPLTDQIGTPRQNAPGQCDIGAIEHVAN